MYKKIEKIIDSDLFVVFVITLCTIISSLWIFNPNNFFIFDDLHNLVNLPQQSFSELMSILPISAYCDRPVGVIIVKILLNIFGLKYIYHSMFMLFIHILNACIIYYLLKRFTNNKSIAVVTALIFSMYPVSNMPSYWESAMFDLFGTTLVLLSALIYLKIKDIKKDNFKVKYWLLSILMIILYYTSLRSKEMFICLPLFLISHSFFDYLKNIRNKKDKFLFRDFLKNNINLLIMIGVMIFYVLCIKALNPSNQYTTNKLDAYYYTFNIIGIIKNYFYYIIIYFNPRSLVYADVITAIHYSYVYIIGIISFSIITFIYSIYKIFKNEYSYILAIIGYTLFIAPVLPMPNLHAVWYLYLPSIPLAFICADIFYKILKIFVYKNKLFITSILVAFVLLMWVNRLNCINDFRIWWIDFAGRERQTYDYFHNLSKKYHNVRNVYVVNVEEGYTTFFIEDGRIVNVAFNDFDLNVILYHENESINADIDYKKDLVVDYNDYNFQLLNFGEYDYEEN